MRPAEDLGPIPLEPDVVQADMSVCFADEHTLLEGELVLEWRV